MTQTPDHHVKIPEKLKNAPYLEVAHCGGFCWIERANLGLDQLVNISGRRMPLDCFPDGEKSDIDGKHVVIFVLVVLVVLLDAGIDVFPSEGSMELITLVI